VRALGIILKALLKAGVHLITVTALLQCRDQFLSLRVRQLRKPVLRAAGRNLRMFIRRPPVNRNDPG